MSGSVRADPAARDRRHALDADHRGQPAARSRTYGDVERSRRHLARLEPLEAYGIVEQIPNQGGRCLGDDGGA